MPPRVARLVTIAAIVAGGVGLSKTDVIAVETIHVYQRVLAPFANRIGGRCRFAPSCSHYAEIVIKRDGLMRGGWKAMKRVARCGPWTPEGTADAP